MKESPLEVLRENIETLKRISGKILVPESSESTKYAEDFIYLRQKIEDLILELKKQNIPIESEIVKLSEIDGEIKKNLKTLYKVLKNSELKNKGEDYPKENWWWHIWEIVEEERRKSLKRSVILFLVIGLILGTVFFIDSYFKTPSEEIIETIEKSHKYLSNNDFKNAEKILKDKILKYENSPELWLALGIVFERENKKEAENAFKRALELYKSEEEFLINRALEYKKLNDLEKSEKDLLQVLKLDQNNSHALYILGTIYEEKNKIAEAIKIYKAIEELGDKADPKILVMSKMRLATLLQKITLPELKGDN